MIGLELKFKCPACGTAGTKSVSIVQLYKINGLDGINYVKVDCKCGATLFVDSSNRPEASTIEEKYKAFEDRADWLGTSEKTFDRLNKDGFFIPKGSSIVQLTPETTVEDAGVAMF